jgi:hypothetical protein
VGEVREVRVRSAASGYHVDVDVSEADREGRVGGLAGVYLRADPSDLQVLEGGSEEERAQLIAQRLR